MVLPEAPRTGETVVCFEPVEKGGAAEMRFEGLGYVLVRLLAMPLADGALREIRIFAHSPAQGRQLVNVAVLTEARGAKDPRRLMVFQDARTVRLVRTAFGVHRVTDDKEQVFNYLTPNRRYFYRRVTPPSQR